MSRLCQSAVLLTAVVLTAAAASIWTQSASASPTLEPWQSDVCAANPCQWSPSTGGYVAGGDGVSIDNYILGGGSWGPDTTPIVNQAGTIEAEAAGVLPELEDIPFLQTITIGSLAFGFGLKIGSTVNTHWLHFEGVGLGTASTTASLTKWVYTTTDPNTGAGWHLVMTIRGVTNGRGCPTGTGCGSDNYNYYNAAQAMNNNIAVVTPDGTLNGAQTWTWFISPARMAGLGLVIDQKLQPFTTQNWDTATGWRVTGGCGDVTTACGYPGGQNDPTLTTPRLRCQLSGADIDCNPGSPLACIISDGSGFFGGAGSSGCGLGTGPESQLNCQADPTDYYCPATAGGGSTFSSSGGLAGPMPDCYGLTSSECEAAIIAARPDATVTIATAPSPDPNVADGRVIATTPTATTNPMPANPTITINPPNSNPDECGSTTDNPHWSNTGQTMLAKGWITCNFTGSVLASGYLWECSESPLSDEPALDSGSWGCSRVFTLTDQPVEVTAGVTSAPVYIGDGVPYTISNGYWIATTFGTPVAQSWSQEDFQPSPP